MSTEKTEAQNQMDALPNTISPVKKEKELTQILIQNIALYRRNGLEICDTFL